MQVADHDNKRHNREQVNVMKHFLLQILGKGTMREYVFRETSMFQ